jgi:CHAT domain-containing protein
LIIVPDGELGYVPFESLLMEEASGTNYTSLAYLLKKYQVSYAYSATLLFDGFKHERNPTHDGVISFAPSYPNKVTDSIQLLALGNFRDQITNLVWNQKEANQITQFVAGKPFTGEFATERSFKENAGDYNILHLAMHALVDDENPMYSRLVFTQSEDSVEDNYLNTYELYNMKLNANLAVLSACNTGSGKLVRGEGIMSLARGFAYAGCPSIVMSHWQVDDEATAQLMTSFYEGLSEGMTKSEALRQAQLTYLESADPRQAHPFYWSSFVMIGENAPIKESSNWWMYMLIGLILVGGIWAISKKKNG